jgi:UDP-N-acetylmuramate--alanine ligase
MYQKNHHIHFVGIGGIGMSGIATILAKQGYRVSGCDTDVTQKSVLTLRSYGCTVHEGNMSAGCADTSIDVLVYSSAIKQDNPEIVAAQQRGIPTIHRAIMLAELMRTKYSIAVTGAHGKTTTTAMIAHILMTANYDPTIIVGGHLNSIDHNAHYGTGPFLVAEADESDRSLIHLYATFGLITNIDLEHLETYRDLDDIQDTYLQFLATIPFYGAAVLCVDDHRIRAILPRINARIITYGLEQEAQVRGTVVNLKPTYSDIIVHTHKKAHEKDSRRPMRIAAPGVHNVLNALGATAVALEIGIPFGIIAEALSTFPGVERRFTYHGMYHGAAVFDDYGHHPTEIAHTLRTARMQAQKGLTVIFQPHRFIRTERLWQQFIDVFLESPINNLIITDIYGAGETPIEGISSARLVQELASHNPNFTIQYIPYEKDHHSIKTALDAHHAAHDLIILLGAGSVNKIAQTLLG